jgi:DNA-binding transcriptional regulator YiaG
MGKRERDMTQMKRFGVRGQPLAPKPHHYRECGLDDVYLISGFEEQKTRYGTAVAIQDIPGLHQAIGLRIINEGKPIAPREFRFLRKNMDLTQEALARRLGVDSQTVARYEKDETSIPTPTDRVLRLMFWFHISSPEQQQKFLDEVRSMIEDEQEESSSAKKFDLTGNGWRYRACIECTH